MSPDSDGGPIDGPAADGDPRPDAPSGLALTTTARVRLHAGDTATLTVTLGGAVMGSTTIRATSLPPGVTIAPVTASAAGEVQLQVVADGAAMPSTITTTLVATDDDDARTAQATADVGVVGAAGTPDLTFDGDGRMDVATPDGVREEIAFADNYDFYTVEQSYRVRRRKAAGGAIDPTWTQEGVASVLGTHVYALPQGQVAITRGFLSSQPPLSDIAAHDATGHRLWVAEQPRGIGNTVLANGVLYIASDAGNAQSFIKQVSLAGVVTPVATGLNPGVGTGPFKDLRVDPTGRVVVSGEVGGTVVVARITAAGAIDATFGASGLLQIDNPLPSPVGVPNAELALTPTGAGYALVYFYGSGGGRSYLVPFSASGVAGTFVGVTTQNANSYATLVRVQPDGKILVGGVDVATPFVRRYLATGELDTSFATGGTLTLPYAPDDITVFAADQRIVVTMIEQAGAASMVRILRVWL